MRNVTGIRNAETRAMPQCGRTPSRMLMPPRMIIMPDTMTASFGAGTPFEPVNPAIIGRMLEMPQPGNDEEPAKQYPSREIERHVNVHCSLQSVRLKPDGTRRGSTPADCSHLVARVPLNRTRPVQCPPCGTTRSSSAAGTTG